MSAETRLAAALGKTGNFRYLVPLEKAGATATAARRILAADPTLRADIEDAPKLRAALAAVLWLLDNNPNAELSSLLDTDVIDNARALLQSVENTESVKP